MGFFMVFVIVVWFMVVGCDGMMFVLIVENVSCVDECCFVIILVGLFVVVVEFVGLVLLVVGEVMVLV